MLEELIKGYLATLEIPVQWGEMDAALHVNNTVYLRYAEAGRIAFLHQYDFQVDTTGKESPVGPILAETSIQYKMPLTFPDTVTVATKVRANSLTEYSFETEQIIISHKKQRIAAVVISKIVSYHYIALHKAPIPDSMHSKLIELMEYK
jgi:acyl-CoA thioester hydrolase